MKNSTEFLRFKYRLSLQEAGHEQGEWLERFDRLEGFGLFAGLAEAPDCNVYAQA